jgi:hypothetical protein
VVNEEETGEGIVLVVKTLLRLALPPTPSLPHWNGGTVKSGASSCKSVKWTLLAVPEKQLTLPRSFV